MDVLSFCLYILALFRHLMPFVLFPLAFDAFFVDSMLLGLLLFIIYAHSALGALLHICLYLLLALHLRNFVMTKPLHVS